MSDVEIEETGAEAQTSVDELFDAEVEVEAQAEPEAEATGEPEPPATVEQTESAPPADKESSAFKTAYLDEKRKRQELEQRLADLEKPQPKAPDPIEDPEGFAAFQDNKMAESAYKLKADISRALMMELKDDYEELEAVFMEMAERDKTLVASIRESDNPAKFAYETAKEHREIQKLRDPAYLEKLIDEKATAKAEEIAKQMLAGMTGKKSALGVPNLAKAPAAGPNMAEAEPVPDLDAIMDGSPF